MRLPIAPILTATLLLSWCACSDSRDTVLEGDGNNDGVGPPVTRSEVILTADKYARLHWTMSAVNRTGISCEGNFVSRYPVGNRIGMGYKWGGWNDIDDFLKKIEEGYGTGTGGGADVYANFSIDCVVGVSCTGFVSRAWHLYEKYTLCYPDPDIQRKFCEITHDIDGVNLEMHQVDGLKKGDAFINDVHTILFVYETREGNPTIMDSSFEGVRFRQLTWAYLASEGYKAIRYNNIKEVSNPRGTLTNPIAVNSDEFPFIHEGNTRDLVSIEIDRYSAAPTIVQAGPEVVYQLEIKSPGTVTMMVSDVKYEGINNDLHLLGSLEWSVDVRMATDCIDRADNTLTKELEEGFYFILIDSPSDMPGEYTLVVDYD
ncbi:MAG: hypothetical protein JSW58_00800 [Candidatus Latescibacterota bacterium]|nr:MAG: hypothetical protein JSW58_00800 [Candidatus Latescibacterota bacterium]